MLTSAVENPCQEKYGNGCLFYECGDVFPRFQFVNGVKP